MKLYLQQADVEDAPCIWEMQKIAFQKLLLKYEDYDTNPASEPLEKVSRRFLQQGRYYYLIRTDQEIIGAASVTDRKDNGRKRLAPISIHSLVAVHLPQVSSQEFIIC